ncbi:hypothetical protein SteCoe_15689 [Stentor coeruleus]|uniref:Uncharacterized protein n=1 Tax=Stentor coeruleus TaxID=5963 RepID=A0A1R2C313_9CILI|nr:hypothetical protein SteCoe_15689 [Stentor coeruleus]
MCIYNPSCEEKEELCNCKNILLFMRSFIQACQAQTEAVKNLSNIASEILDKLSAKSQRNIPILNMNESDGFSVSASRTELMNLLCKGKNNQMFSFQLEYDIPSPIYKDRLFKLEAKIIDSSGQTVELSNCIFVQILLFTKDSPPKQLVLTTTGEKMIKGNTEIKGKSLFVFNKIAIQNVTSHYLSGALYLVLLPNNCDLVKPLVIEDIVVRARKMKEDLLIKKQKSEENL